MYEETLKTALQNAGVYVEDSDFSMTLQIRDYIEDSLSFISFFVEVETLFEIEIPDEFYNQKIYDYTLEKFVSEVIQPL